MTQTSIMSGGIYQSRQDVRVCVSASTREHCHTIPIIQAPSSKTVAGYAASAKSPSLKLKMSAASVATANSQPVHAWGGSGLANGVSSGTRMRRELANMFSVGACTFGPTTRPRCLSRTGMRWLSAPAVDGITA
jgi:hypothetical protein